ncbi:MAG TPA: GTPase HflX [Myxococcales bacterium]|nr:GTPase HflX [Deltaproteobacteria bacterium]HAA58223.1 GTPase HflX [Myxococcales bacterium]|tara:strand:+ start:1966 stop:3297 length:1332 start_codon:yes stop_codon:yes gene_type:complete
MRYKNPLERTQKAILVGIQRPDTTNLAHQASVEELGRLAETLGFEVVDTIHQKRQELCTKTALGSGKLQQLKQRIEEIVQSDADDEVQTSRGPRQRPLTPVVIMNDALTPLQFRSLEKELEVSVFDRTGVILEIFRRHAKTRAARLQVELASLQYEALHQRERRGKNMDQQAGGIGAHAKGAGEAAHKMEKSRLRARTAQLRREIAAIAREKEHRCAQRGQLASVALVGYTNAGKSTWMRKLTESEVSAKDRLFETLDTTTRVLQHEGGQRILMSDTVGFIENIPHELVASFHSTLEEARQASVLLHVVDASSLQVETHIRVTQEVLRELHAGDIPQILLMNKADQVDEERLETLQMCYPDALFVSIYRDEDLEAVTQHIVSFFEQEMFEETLFIPYEKHHLVYTIHDSMRVLEASYEDKGTQLSVLAFARQLKQIHSQLHAA